MSRGDAHGRVVEDGLLGRQAELDLIDVFLADAAAHGAALLLSGDPGIGKTVLLDTAAQRAAASGTLVLRTSGVEFLADLGYGGIGQALVPLHDELELLRPVHRHALAVALGAAEGPPADRLVVFTGLLTLLRQASLRRPLLLVVDDLQWLDRASAAALAFAARRLPGSRVGLLAAFRPGYESFFERSGLPEHEVRPLDPDAARRLLQAQFPALAPPVVERVLADAEGNPLALLELPAALSTHQRSARDGLPAVLPLSRRLRALFASRVDELEPRSRRLLLLAALEGSGDLAVLISEGSGGYSLADLAPAERRQLLHVDGASRVVFRHPLVSSTLVELATAAERRDAHRTLAALLADQPDRRTWHLADATVDPDEHVAALLEETALRSRHRGDAVGAVTALLRAADLSPDRAGRSRRLAEAAYLGADVTGALSTVTHLLVEARRADPEQRGSLHAAMAACALLFDGEGDLVTAQRVLAGAVDDHVLRTGGGGPADPVLTEALHVLLMLCLYREQPEAWAALDRVLARLDTDLPDVLQLMITVNGDPARTTAREVALLDDLLAGLAADTDPTRICRIATIALLVDRAADCREALWRVVADGRSGGAVRSAIRALVLLAVDGCMAGRWDECARVVDEGIDLCLAHGYLLSTWPFRLCRALLAAARGDDGAATAEAEAIAGWSTPRGVRAVRHYARHARGLAALSRGDHEEAYAQLSAISPAGVLAPHVPHALWVALDLVEAAVGSDRLAEAAAHAEAMRACELSRLSTRFALLTAGAAALVAPVDEAAERFEEALAVPGADRWPFELARLHLACGEHLRRVRRGRDARPHLDAARELFHRLGARPWETRARNALRSTGLDTGTDDAERVTLTPEEREIALLAAAGLTNKEIGQQLYLSHRTVGARLYKVFPKLGVASRASLRDALAEHGIAPEPEGGPREHEDGQDSTAG